jgi:hypothetical protein
MQENRKGIIRNETPSAFALKEAGGKKRPFKEARLNHWNLVKPLQCLRNLKAIFQLLKWPTCLLI